MCRYLVISSTPCHHMKTVFHVLATTGPQYGIRTQAFISGRKKKISFNDVLNTFYFGVRHMSKDYIDGETGHLLLPSDELLFSSNSSGSFISTIA